MLFVVVDFCGKKDGGCGSVYDGFRNICGGFENKRLVRRDCVEKKGSCSGGGGGSGDDDGGDGGSGDDDGDDGGSGDDDGDDGDNGDDDSDDGGSGDDDGGDGGSGDDDGSDGGSGDDDGSDGGVLPPTPQGLLHPLHDPFQSISLHVWSGGGDYWYHGLLLLVIFLSLLPPIFL